MTEEEAKGLLDSIDIVVNELQEVLPVETVLRLLKTDRATGHLLVNLLNNAYDIQRRLERIAGRTQL